MLPSSLNIGILCQNSVRRQFLCESLQNLQLVAHEVTSKTLSDWLETHSNAAVLVDLVDEDVRMANTRLALEITNRFFRPVLLLSPRESVEDADAFHDESDPFHYLHPDFTPRELRLSLELACFRHRVQGQAEGAVQLSRLAMQECNQALIHVNPGGLISFMNTEAERLTGWLLQLARGRRLIEVFRLADPNQVMFMEALFGQKGLPQDLPERVELHPYDGEPLEVTPSMMPVLRDDASVFCYLLSFQPVATAMRGTQNQTAAFPKLARTS